jgi:hypothetical protein
MRLGHFLLGSLMAFSPPIGLAVGATRGVPSDGPTPACTYFVAPTGSDRNNGTSVSTPFATIEKAQSAVRRGGSKVVCLRGGTYNRATPLTLTSSDDGETWQYYPPDGVDSAVLDGRGATDIVQIVGGSNIVINGLKVQNFHAYGIHSQGGTRFGVPAASGNTIENCDIGFNTMTSWNSGAFYSEGAAPKTAIKGNYVHDVGSQGIAINTWFNPSDKIDGSVIADNVVLRAVQRMSDGGAIYVSMHGGDQTSHVTVTNNFVRDYGAPGVTGAAGIYLDDNASHVTVTGNVVAPPTEGSVGAGNLGAAAVEIHNGNHNTISGNILDLGDSGRVWAAIWYQDSASIAGMAGNRFTGNIVVSAFIGIQHTNFTGQTGYTHFQNVPSDFTIRDNVYHNRAGGQVRTDGPLASDSNPIFENPRISGWTYQIADGSPVFRPSVNFPRIVGGWGPPGFVIPRPGAASSP